MVLFVFIIALQVKDINLEAGYVVSYYMIFVVLHCLLPTATFDLCDVTIACNPNDPRVRNE